MNTTEPAMRIEAGSIHEGREAPVLFSARGAAGGYAMFLLIGAVQAMYGPALPALRTTFALSASTAGFVLSAHFAGALAGILASGLATARFSSRGRLLGATCFLAGGMAMFALAPVWPVAVVAAFAIGLGFGGLVVGYNTLFATAGGRNSSAMVNLINAAFGVGAVAGPLVIGIASAARFRLVFAGGAVFVLALLPFVAASPAVRGPARSVEARAGRFSVALVAAFVLLFVLYEGVETDIGGWEPTQLVAHGFTSSTAAALTALFWAGITLGRVVVASVGTRIPPPTLVISGFAAVVILAAFAQIGALTPVAYGLTGLAIAPIFPAGLLWVTRALPAVPSGPAFVIVGALVGGACFPPLVGRLIGAAGADVLPGALAGIGIAALCVAVPLRRFTRTP